MDSPEIKDSGCKAVVVPLNNGQIASCVAGWF